MSNYLALTIIADDRPGIIETVSDVIASNGGNWLESSMSRLAGKFAGILLVEIPEQLQQALISKLETLHDQGIRIHTESSQAKTPSSGQSIFLSVVGNDRPGIVSEISGLLAKQQVNLEELTTQCESAPMSAEILFRATAHIQLPNHLSREDLQSSLESLSDDLMIELEPEN